MKHTLKGIIRGRIIKLSFQLEYGLKLVPNLKKKINKKYFFFYLEKNYICILERYILYSDFIVYTENSTTGCPKKRPLRTFRNDWI